MRDKSIGIIQPYFFPYIGYFQLINEVDEFVLYDAVSFRKNSWLNRNYIKDKGTSSLVQITVPVKKKSSYSLINEVNVSLDIKWKNQIKNLIFFNYKKAPFFGEVYEPIVELLYNECESLHEYNSMIVKGLCKQIGINTPIVTQNEKHQTLEANLKVRSEERNTKVKEQRVYDLCELYNANCYINPINGMELYEFEKFNQQGLKLAFIKAEEITYDQFKAPFEPYLSIIDVLMHNGFDGTKLLLSQNQIIKG